MFKNMSIDDVFNKIKEIYKSLDRKDYWMSFKTYKEYEDSEIKRMTAEIDANGGCHNAPFTLIDMNEPGRIPYASIYDGGVDGVSEFNPDIDDIDDIDYIDDGTLRYIYGQHCYWVSNQQVLRDDQDKIKNSLGDIVMLTMSNNVPLHEFEGIASSIYEKSAKSRYINNNRYMHRNLKPG